MLLFANMFVCMCWLYKQKTRAVAVVFIVGWLLRS